MQLTTQPDGGHFWFCQYGDHVRRPSKIQTVWRERPLGQIWCLWKNLNQNIP